MITSPDGGPRPDASPDASADASADAVTPPRDAMFTGRMGTVLFVTQVPVSGFSKVTSTFGNHLGDVGAAPRGGDLMIRYPDGALRNLTREAGYGGTGMQGARSIAVREPAVHWSGNRALFSMVIGAPSRQYESGRYRWQIYEVSGLAQNEPVAITRVANQPEAFNNVAPCYAPDDRVIFTSDRPRDGAMHLYPQLDEYESAPIVTGLWSLDPASGDLRLLNHAPSGAFSPSVDSFGRVIFTKWDHLQRDQQVDYALADQRDAYGAFTFADESAGAARMDVVRGMEVFPEPRDNDDPDYTANVRLHTFNQFYPWEINVDGTAEETLNHVGRHELGGSYSEGAFADDPNLTYDTPDATHVNRYYLAGDGGVFHLREDPRTPGTLYATYAREFGTASAGALLRFNAAPSTNPEAMVLEPVTHRDSYNQPEDPTMAGGSTGHYRNPLPMSDGTVIASHTSETGPLVNRGTREAPAYNYAFRLRTLRRDGAHHVADTALTQGLNADVQWWDPDALITYRGPLWELDAVEVAPRARPTARTERIEEPEQRAFAAAGVDIEQLRAWMRQRDLALIVTRNVTYRDRADVQQPFNLRVPNGAQTVGRAGRIYDVTHLQVFQGDALRGYGGAATPDPGRRLLARPMHDPALPVTPGGDPAGSVRVAQDGSVAAFVPARRALTWQLTGPTGNGVVRERNWVSFQPGEIRACPVCHGLNTQNQAGAAVPTNPPMALEALLRAWRP